MACGCGKTKELLAQRAMERRAAREERSKQVSDTQSESYTASNSQRKIQRGTQ